MAKYKHLRASLTEEVPVSAERFFDAAADWVGHVPHLTDFPFPLAKSAYDAGSSAGKIPCTRLVYVDKTAMPKEQADMLPEFFRETLLKVDRETYCLFYTLEGESLGMRNYFASKEIEPLENGRCRVTVASRFDLIEGVSAEATGGFLQAVYKSLIGGIGRYAAKA
jgi:hypothetical protein